MRYFFAIVACFALIFLYGGISGIFFGGILHGAIPTLILFLAIYFA
jgi:hypothetical protein